MTAMLCLVLAAALPARVADTARVSEIRAMLRPEAGFAETRIGNRAFWDAIAAVKPASGFLNRARKIAAEPMPVPDDARYREYEVWTRPIQKCKSNLGVLALAECVENKGEFLTNIVEYLEMFSTRRCWTGRYHDRDCLAFDKGEPLVELGNGQIAEVVSVTLDVLRGRLPPDVRARALAATRRNCLDTFLNIARGLPDARNGRKARWYMSGSNWNAACCEYMVSSALHILDDPVERAEAIELAERSTKGFLAGYTDDGLCLEGNSYWQYGYGQYMRLALWVREATGSFLSFVNPFARKAYESSYGSVYTDGLGPNFGDSNPLGLSKWQHLGSQIWPELDRFDAKRAELFVSLPDFMLRHREFSDPEAFLARKQRPYDYPLRSWYPSEIGQLICRPRRGEVDKGAFYAAIQGGHNARPHGHHDVGAYCIAVGGVEVMGDPGNSKYDLDTFGPKRYENPMRNSFGHPVPRVDGCMQSNGKAASASVLSASFGGDADFVEYDLKRAYPTATNLVSLTRSLEYQRSKNRVVVTDKVEFSGRGAFETALITLGRIEPSGNGSYVFFSQDGEVSARCEISVTGSPWHLETVPLLSGTKHERVGGGDPLRAAVVLDEPVQRAVVKVEWSNASTKGEK